MKVGAANCGGRDADNRIGLILEHRTGSFFPGATAGTAIDQAGSRRPPPSAASITTWEPGRSFADLQEKGPYRFWRHNHTFQADGPRTVMEDRVYYTPPLGLFGRLANRVFIRSTLRKIFQYRGDVIRLRFGVS